VTGHRRRPRGSRCVAIADADRIRRHTAEEVGRTVDRVDDPQALGVDGQLLVVWAFFAQKRIVRTFGAQDVTDGVLDDERGADEQVTALFQLEVQRIAGVLEGDAAAHSGRTDGNLQTRGIIH
jgi:hypothetical protein